MAAFGCTISNDEIELNGSIGKGGCPTNMLGKPKWWDEAPPG
jgi:hypothetical protein